MESMIADKKVKHTIYLDPAVSRRLKREKGETDRSISEIIEATLSTRYNKASRGSSSAAVMR